LSVVDHAVATQVQQGIIEVGQGFLEVAEEEIGDTLLKVGDSEVLVKLDGALVAFDLLQESTVRSAV
jgi:hypothetical protein